MAGKTSWYQRNRTQALAEMRARRATPEGRRKRQIESRKYREKNRDRINAWFRDYYHNSPARKQSITARACLWQRSPKGKRYKRQHGAVYSIKHRDRINAWKRVYTKRPDVRRKAILWRRQWWPKHYRRNKARLLAAMRPHRLTYMSQRKVRMATPPEERKAIQKFISDTLKLPKVTCAYCLRTTKKPVFDHIIPLARGGPHVLLNLCVACPACNTSKRDKTPEEFLQWRKEVGI